MKSIQSAESTKATKSPVPSTNHTAKSLEALAETIRKDAARDSLHYLLRSNTNHDGE